MAENIYDPLLFNHSTVDSEIKGKFYELKGYFG